MSWALAIWCAAVALVSAALAVTRTTIVHSIIWIVATLLSLAAAFFALGAGFAGAIQILIYAGAITVVFVFVVMTVDVSPEARARERARLSGAWRAPAAVGPKALGELLFGRWAAVVELASFLLLAALLGVRHLARPVKGANE
jgi:NADH-quinone oxidoreductase subunit J